MLNSDDIKRQFPNVISKLSGVAAQLFYMPKENKFYIVTDDRKRIYKTFDELTEHENSLKDKRGNLKRVPYKISNTIDIL